MQLKVGQEAEFLLDLIDSAGNPVLGVTTPSVKIYKAGTSAPVAKAVAASDWKELNATDFPGVYALKLSAADTDTLGCLGVSVKGASSKPTVSAHTVVASLAEDARLAAVAADATASAAGAAAALVRKIVGNGYKVDKAAATLTVFDDDNVTPLLVFSLKDENGTPNATRIFERSL